MYAVFRSGGKQYRASEGDLVRVERLDAQEGDDVEFDQVLMVGDGADVTLGSPLVEDSRVRGIVTAQARGKKIVVTKFKRRKNYKRIMGHRQHFTEVEITSIGPEAQAAEVEVAEAEVSEVEAAEAEVSEVEAAEAEVSEVEAVEAEAAVVETPEADDGTDIGSSKSN